MQPAIEQGQIYGRLQVLSRIPDGRYRLRCRGCGDDGVIASATALQRGRLQMCWACVQSAKQKRKQPTSNGAAPARIRVRRDVDGWALPEAA